MTRTLILAEQLISLPSITPDDAGCQALIASRLQPLGFVCETLESGPADFRVTNLWAKRAASAANTAQGAPKTIVFAGHTDVVPTGPVAQWTSAPFAPTHRDGKLYGRGSSDMKASLAAFVVAVEEFVAAQPSAPLNIAFLLTSDEEGPAVDGTVMVCRELQKRGEVLDYCIVGEPTSVQRTGDMIDHADVVKVPGHRAGGAELPLAEQHAHFRGGAVDVVGQALHHHRHTVRREAFIDHVLEVDGFTGQAGAFLDGALQRVLGHRGFAGLLHHQTQARVQGRVGTVAGGDHDFLGQLAKQLASGISSLCLAFCFPLRAHVRSIAKARNGVNSDSR